MQTAKRRLHNQLFVPLLCAQSGRVDFLHSLSFLRLKSGCVCVCVSSALLLFALKSKYHFLCVTVASRTWVKMICCPMGGRAPPPTLWRIQTHCSDSICSPRRPCPVSMARWLHLPSPIRSSQHTWNTKHMRHQRVCATAPPFNGSGLHVLHAQCTEKGLNAGVCETKAWRIIYAPLTRSSRPNFAFLQHHSGALSLFAQRVICGVDILKIRTP